MVDDFRVSLGEDLVDSPAMGDIADGGRHEDTRELRAQFHVEIVKARLVIIDDEEPCRAECRDLTAELELMEPHAPVTNTVLPERTRAQAERSTEIGVRPSRSSTPTSRRRGPPPCCATEASALGNSDRGRAYPDKR